MARPKAKTKPKSHITRTFCVPSVEFDEWDEFLNNCKDIDISASQFIWQKIKTMNIAKKEAFVISVSTPFLSV